MEIEEAFSSAIATPEFDVGGELENELHGVAEGLFTNNQIEHTEDHVRVAMIAFMAGRVHKEEEDVKDLRIPVPMTLEGVYDYIGFLIQKGEA